MSGPSTERSWTNSQSTAAELAKAYTRWYWKQAHFIRPIAAALIVLTVLAVSVGWEIQAAAIVIGGLATTWVSMTRSNQVKFAAAQCRPGRTISVAATVPGLHLVVDEPGTIAWGTFCKVAVQGVAIIFVLRRNRRQAIVLPRAAFTDDVISWMAATVRANSSSR